jgi:hypothetical protein
LAAAVLLVAFAACGCLPDQGRAPPPTLYLDPPSAMQDAILPVNLTAAGVDFGKCVNQSPADVVFTSAGGASEITVYDLDPIADSVLHAQIVVAEDASVGTHSVGYQCDGNTLLEGVFEVRSKADDAILILEPADGQAGSISHQIVIFGDGASFVDGVSHVIFGDGTAVQVKEQIVQSAEYMSVVVDITHQAPIGEMEVAVVTASQVARGEFTVTENIYPTVQVYPDSVERPGIVGPPAETALMILGNGVSFVDPETVDGGIDEATQVSFPANPGITVTELDVTPQSSQIDLVISIDHVALLGPTALRVSTGEEVAETDFTVLPAADQPVLVISPPTLSRGVTAAMVLAQATNFTFDQPLSVQFADEGCHVESYEVLLPAMKAMALEVTIDNDFVGDGTVLEIASASGTAAAHLAISDDLGPVIVPDPLSPTIEQGDTDIVLLKIQGGVFDDAAQAAVLMRSGLRILLQAVTGEGESIFVQLEAAGDAPVGPALIRVDNAGDELETFIEIVPSTAVPYMSLSPQVVLSGRRTVVMEVAADGLDLLASPPVIRFDDPAVVVEGISVADAGTASLTVDVAPTARSDMTVAYVEAEGGRAAATFRGIPARRPTATADPAELIRGGSGPHIVQVELSGGSGFGDTVAQVLDEDEINLAVERVTVFDEESLELEFTIEDDGPGGWLGVLLTTGAEQVVVPLHVVAGDESLTMSLSPPELDPGARAIQVQATAPPYAEFDDVFTAASTGVAGAFATLEGLQSASLADVLVDLAFDLQVPEGGVPIFLTASKGAVVGFLLSDTLQGGLAYDSTPFEEVFAADEVRVIAVAADSLPALVTISESEPDKADLGAELLASGSLVAEDVAQSGVLWLVDSSPANLAATPVGDPGGLPSTIRVYSKGDGAVLLVEPDDQLTEALPLGTDPCVAPFLGLGTIGQALDVDRLELGATACRLVVSAVARLQADRPWSTPDLWIELRDETDGLLAANSAWPTAADDDPRIHIDPGIAGRQIVCGAELGTAGPYLINVRRTATIREIDTNPAVPFLELELEPSASIDPLSIELIDAELGILLETLSLAGQPITNDGIVVISGTAMAEADLQSQPVAVFPDGPFAVRLLDEGVLVDAIEIGGDGDYGEGNPLVQEPGACYQRIGGVDSNDNLYDFRTGWVSTPGL